MPGKVQLELTLNTWGGARKGAGRPAKGSRPSEPHTKRPFLRPTEPVHVVIRVVADVTSLRRREAFRALREATITTAKRDNFHIVHISIQGNHVHLIVEALDRIALARGMQGFQISAAKHINRALSRRGRRRRGCVFQDRYCMRILKSPKSVRHALAYALNNWRHHGYDRDHPWRIDPFSSAITFAGWKELEGQPLMPKPPRGYDTLITWLPKTWLLRTGWERHGPISVHEVPGG